IPTLWTDDLSADRPARARLAFLAANRPSRGLRPGALPFRRFAGHGPSSLGRARRMFTAAARRLQDEILRRHPVAGQHAEDPRKASTHIQELLAGRLVEQIRKLGIA